MTFSHTQISQYLRCPRSYRYRYLDGWKEKETKASLLFGCCFEKAVVAYFAGQDSAANAIQRLGPLREAKLEYSKADSWDRMLRQGVHLLEMFARGNRVQIGDYHRDLQVKISRLLPRNNEFVAYIDALGYLDNSYCLIDWKTTTSKYSKEPRGLLALDPQLICYSWLTEISEVALVVFVRKHIPEIQYLKTTISEEQRNEFGRLIEATAAEIQTSQFLPHSGIRFPHNGCVSCAHLGLCLGDEGIAERKLVRQAGASELDWLDSLRTNGLPMARPKLNRRRALFVLTKIDEILAWDKGTQRERDTKFVELGRYLCEVRAAQYWRLDRFGSFDEFLERKFPDSRRKAYYLMAIHEQIDACAQA